MLISVSSWDITRDSSMDQNVISHGTLSEEIRYHLIKITINVKIKKLNKNTIFFSELSLINSLFRRLYMM